MKAPTYDNHFVNISSGSPMAHYVSCTVLLTFISSLHQIYFSYIKSIISIFLYYICCLIDETMLDLFNLRPSKTEVAIVSRSGQNAGIH